MYLCLYYTCFVEKPNAAFLSVEKLHNCCVTAAAQQQNAYTCASDLPISNAVVFVIVAINIENYSAAHLRAGSAPTVIFVRCFCILCGPHAASLFLKSFVHTLHTELPSLITSRDFCCAVTLKVCSEKSS